MVGMSERELAEQEQLVTNNAVSMAQSSDVDMYYEDILQGRQPAAISHAGGEMSAMEDSVPHPKCVKIISFRITIDLIWHTL